MFTLASSALLSQVVFPGGLISVAIVFFIMATSLMAFPDAIDNGPSARSSKLKFGHAASVFLQQLRIFLNANLPASERAFIVVAQLCRVNNRNRVRQ